MLSTTQYVSVEMPMVGVEPPKVEAGRGDVPVKSWISRVIPNGAFIDGIAWDAVFFAVELRNRQVVEIGYSTNYPLTGKDWEEIAKL